MNRINLNYVQLANALPGHARNIGLKNVKYDFVAFLDVHTIARPQWLEISLATIISNSILGVWGGTCFNANNAFEKLVRDGFYGIKQRETLPGSVFKIEVFSTVGQFIHWVRAGEDTEWMLRLELLKVPIVSHPFPLIDYVGLNGLNLIKLIRKWYRNYSSSKELPHLFPIKLLLWVAFYPLLILLAFNWNYLIADWRMDSIFYVGHVTKMFTILPIFAYFVLRGIVLPLSRGISVKQLLPFRFMTIGLICALADGVKLFVLSIPKRNNRINARYL